MGLNGSEVTEVEPLDGFFGIGSRTGDIKTIDGSHLLNAL